MATDESIAALGRLDADMLARLRVRHRVKTIVRSHLESRGFVEIDTPVLGPPVQEYEPPELSVNVPDGRTLYLNQSPQLYKQVLVQAGVDRYFGFANCFRFEALEGGAPNHLRSFMQLDLELTAESVEEVQRVVEDLILELYTAFGKPCSPPFRSIKAAEALERYGTDQPDLEPDADWSYLWVTDFPMLVETRDGELEPTRHVFAQPWVEPRELRSRDELRNVEAKSFDLLVNGLEIGGGNMRIHRAEDLEHMIDLMGYDKRQFDLILLALDRHARPHGGFAFGFDRLAMQLAGVPHIEMANAFLDPLR